MSYNLRILPPKKNLSVPEWIKNGTPYLLYSKREGRTFVGFWVEGIWVMPYSNSVGEFLFDYMTPEEAIEKDFELMRAAASSYSPS